LVAQGFEHIIYNTVKSRNFMIREHSQVGFRCRNPKLLTTYALFL
jgi:hypothetical protein